MAKIKDCPGFETFGADVKEARKAKNLARKDLAEKVNIDTRYLANIENEGTIPSLPVIIQLVKICGLPMERYFNPAVMREESEPVSYTHLDVYKRQTLFLAGANHRYCEKEKRTRRYLLGHRRILKKGNINTPSALRFFKRKAAA